MRKVVVAVLALLLVVALAGSTMAQAPTLQSKSPAAPHAAPLSPAPLNTLWDQPASTTNTNAYANQDFETAYDAYDMFIADDFQIGDAYGWTIGTIFVPGDLWNGGTTLANANSLNFQIYADNGGVPAGDPRSGGALWSLSVAPSDAQIALSNGNLGYPSNVTLTLSTPINLAAGHYWLVFYPQMDFGLGYGQYGRNVSTTTNGNVAQVINPGGGFAFPVVWTSVQDPGTWALAEHDFAYRLEGTINPPPANTMHVGSVVMSKTGTGPYTLTAKGKIHNTTHTPLAGVKVQAQWTQPNGTKLLRQFTSTAQGAYQFNLANQTQTGRYRFCIVGLVKAGYTYVKADNDVNPPCKYITIP